MDTRQGKGKETLKKVDEEALPTERTKLPCACPSRHRRSMRLERNAVALALRALLQEQRRTMLWR
jgi:hypothetical protein